MFGIKHNSLCEIKQVKLKQKEWNKYVEQKLKYKNSVRSN